MTAPNAFFLCRQLITLVAQLASVTARIANQSDDRSIIADTAAILIELDRLRALITSGVPEPSEHRENNNAVYVGLEVSPETLTDRERETVWLLAQGRRNSEIARALSISVKTVDTHRQHALQKLNLRNNSDLTRWAIKHQLIPAP